MYTKFKMYVSYIGAGLKRRRLMLRVDTTIEK